MPALPRPVPAIVRRPSLAARPLVPRVLVVGDLMLDVVLAPDRRLVSGTDVPGRVSLRQGGSAANTARWLARLGVRSTLISSVGRDSVGRALVESIRSDGVVLRAVRVPGQRTGRIGVYVGPGGERSFVADRGAADALRPEDLRPIWFRGAHLLHLPVYSLLGVPLGAAGLAAIDRARAAGSLVSLDLASVEPLLSRGRRAARSLIHDVTPDLLFGTSAEVAAFLGPGKHEELLRYAPVAVVKRGELGATVLARSRSPEGTPLRFEIASRPVSAADTTGAGDAFDAGFIASWLASRSDDRATPSVLRRAALAGNRVAARHLGGQKQELVLG